MFAFQQPSAFNLMKLEASSLHIDRSDKEVLSGITFSVEAGEIYALLGGNGAGKSTVLLSFLGFLLPTFGHICVNGRDVGKNLVETRKSIAYLPESTSLYEHLNAHENLQYFLQLSGIAADKPTLDDVFERVALASEARNRKLRDYSKGMRQKVAIALAILRDSEILLLDEPTSGLDPTAIDEFHHLICGLADRGKTVLMVTHDVYGACQVADKIGLLRGGVLVGEFAAVDGARIDIEVVHRAFSSALTTQSATALADNI